MLKPGLAVQDEPENESDHAHTREMHLLSVTILCCFATGCSREREAETADIAISDSAPPIAPTILRLLVLRESLSTAALDEAIRHLTKVFCSAGDPVPATKSWIDTAEVQTLYPQVKLSAVRAIVGCGQFQTHAGDRPCGIEFERRGRCVSSFAASGKL